MSVCQYLASEVHKPLAAPEVEPKPKPKKKAPPPKKTAPQQSKPKQPAAPPEPPSPAPVVKQIMEMGFPRRHIEYAVQVRCHSLSYAIRIFAFLFVCDKKKKRRKGLMLPSAVQTVLWLFSIICWYSFHLPEGVIAPTLYPNLFLSLLKPHRPHRATILNV